MSRKSIKELLRAVPVATWAQPWRISEYTLGRRSLLSLLATYPKVPKGALKSTVPPGDGAANTTRVKTLSANATPPLLPSLQVRHYHKI